MTAEAAALERLLAAVTARGAPGDAAVVAAPAALAGPLEAALAEAGVAVALVDRSPVESKEALLAALAGACQFPGWFGFNWDALADALAGWCARPAAGHVLLFRDLDRLEGAAPEAARTFLEVVEEVRAERRADLRLVRLVHTPRRAHRSRR